MLRWLTIAFTLTTVAVTDAGSKGPHGGRIVGGTEAFITDFSYQLSLRHNGYHDCGAILISSGWSVTAAHCTFDRIVSSLSLRAGSANRQSGGQIRSISQIIEYPNFDPATSNNDITLLQINLPFVLGFNVHPILLPSSKDFWIDGTSAVVSGWGIVNGNSLVAPVQLRQVMVHLVNQAKCNHAYGGRITDSMLCAGHWDGRGDACQMDSGGPLVVDKKLVGIVSWGNQCALPGFPGVYVRVALFRRWITDVTGLYGSDAAISDFPWQLSLRFNNVHYCGATLIHIIWAISSARCTTGANLLYLTIRAGTAHSVSGGQSRYIEKIINHPNYNALTHDNDISLVKASKGWGLDTGLWPARLPDQGEEVATGVFATVSGWGSLAENHYLIPDTLQQVTVPVVDQDSCNSAYGGAITGNMFCAGYENEAKGTCLGDYGGPLVSQGFILGVASWGKDCALPGYPGVYTRVSVYRDWIRNNTNF